MGRLVSLPAEKDWIEKLCKMEKDPSDIVFVIETKIGKRAIGVIGLHRIDWLNRNATTGTVIGEGRLRNKGYATEAKMLLLKYAFDTLGLHKVIARVYADNLASIRYSEKCGYVKEGTLRHEIFHNGSFMNVVLLGCFRETWFNAWQTYDIM